MRTRSSSNLIVESSTTLKRRNHRRCKQRVEPFSLEETSVVTMADQRTMTELLQAPTEGYGDAIVIPAILAENLSLILWYSNSSRIWLEKEPPRSILTWENLVSKFINQFFPPSKTINLRNVNYEFSRNVLLNHLVEAWPFHGYTASACPHYGFTKLHQLDTFYNALTPTDQDSLNASAGGNLLTKTPRDALAIFENKSKVRNSQNKPVVTKVEFVLSFFFYHPFFLRIVALADAVKAMLLQKSSPTASIKAVKEICVTCGGSHPYHQCLATDGNIFLEYRDNIQGYVFSQAASTLLIWETYRIPSSEFQTQAPIDEPVVAPKPKPSIPYPSRANKQKLREKDDNLASKFLVECLALADLGASINLMPLSIWKKLSLPKLTPTQMILELADRSTTSPSGIAEDVFVKVEKFHFLAEFVVVDYVVDPRVPLILGRSFLRTASALIDVYGEELTLLVDDEAITFKVVQTSRYSYNDVALINRIDVIDVAYPILSTSSSSLIPFEEGDFILEEIEACLTNDSIPSGIDDDDFDLEGDLLLLEKLLNDDPSSPLPPKELHVEELKIVKSSIDDPPELELKDLPPHLEYAFLEGTDKLPVIFAKNLKEDEKVRLLKVLKSHKRAIA
ncbi:reverse transcriptase domain-containing protein [Tanacetum coccineum]|uniref:Reverse transcriptase domain-containing protein n=1 Tax=Tanacetum coccineum TaxID=301880 RepID=A0ABQ5EFW9_9ASTR